MKFQGFTNTQKIVYLKQKFNMLVFNEKKFP